MERPYEEESWTSFVDEYRYELENRVRNLLWTVSGDYELDIKPDLDSFERSKYITLYDAVRQGAFARFFDRDEFGMYLMKKLYLGAQEAPLMMLAQMCVDQAAVPRITEERKGVASLRRHAFEDILEHEFDRLAGSGHPAARLKIAMLQQGIDGHGTVPAMLQGAMEELTSLRGAGTTGQVIRQLDRLYNQLADPRFEEERGSLEQVLAVGLEELKKFTWQDFLDETAQEVSAEELLKEADAAWQEPQEEPEQERGRRAKRLLITEEAARKLHSYIELNFGTSYLNELEQERLNRRICRGVHADCRLYFTDGILASPVLENNTYVLAGRTKEANIRYYRQHERVSRHNISQLGDILKRSLQARDEQESLASSHGQIQPRKLWKLGRTEDRKLFRRQFRKQSSDFVVDVLIDSSGSQRVRQSQIALQGYILSAALSRAGIPHRVMGFFAVSGNMTSRGKRTGG